MIVANELLEQVPDQDSFLAFVMAPINDREAPVAVKRSPEPVPRLRASL